MPTLLVPLKRCDPIQLSILKDYFSRNCYPNNEELKYLANKTGLSKRKVDKWFNNHRCVLKSKNSHANLFDPKIIVIYI